MADGDKELDPELELEPGDAEGDQEVAEVGEGEQPQPDQQADAEAEPEVQEQERPVEQQTRQVPRSESRIRTLVEENRRKDSELAEVRRWIDDLTRQVQQPSPQRETAEQRAARFAVMTPQEQIAESLRESEARWEQRMQGFQAQTAEAQDRTQYQAKAASNPVYAKWAPKVEGKRAELAARGQFVDRETILKYMIGEAALERLNSKEGKREVQKAEQRVANARVRTGNSASDTQATRRQNTSLERRLENVQI